VIDMHSHILPGLDDGAASVDVSTAMLDAAAALGITTIVATPHLHRPLTDDYDATARSALAAIQEPARERGIEVLRGFEVRLTADLPARLRAGEPITLGDSQAVLVDLPFNEWRHDLDEALFNIQVSGFLPILAHPERYPVFQRRPERARELAARGIALQVTTGSFAGAFGHRARSAAEALLRAGAVHLIASDAHSADDRMAAVPAGLERLGALVGEAGVRQLTADAPRHVLATGTAPAPVLPLPSAPRTAFRRLLGLEP
jgi:protein-tyrosine phosphatase